MLVGTRVNRRRERRQRRQQRAQEQRLHDEHSPLDRRGRSAYLHSQIGKINNTVTYVPVLGCQDINDLFVRDADEADQFCASRVCQQEAGTKRERFLGKR